ncbi:DUF1330 domain-containing protein [Planctobacterium marinum]|uniref:DUF1330 domain-containing protein n=1 Tax=Planctobacterium marinum TaxID=1631968 RepID=A0AA48HIP6_9ALTE|nr:hypothetical protein MACH26_15300 [Planctobacterium marinum]
MAGFIIATYNIVDQLNYQRYLELVRPTLESFDGEVLVADYDSEPLEGTPPMVSIVIRFASKAIAKAWYTSVQYQDIIHLRVDTTVGSAVLTEAYQYAEPPSALKTSQNSLAG